MTDDILVAGVGNIFLGDDGFGCEVLRRLAGEPFPAGVRVIDYGIGGVHLVYDLLEGYRSLVLVDTIARGGEPGSVYVIGVDRDDLVRGGPGGLPPTTGAQFDAHSMDPASVLGSLEGLGGTLPRTFVVGCEPADTGEGIGLSPAVAAAVEPATTAVRELVAQELSWLAPNGNVTIEGVR